MPRLNPPPVAHGLTLARPFAFGQRDDAPDEGPAPGSSGNEDRDEDRDLESVYQRHAARISRWVARLAGPGFDIEDVVHEVFLVVRRRLPEFRGDARMSTWLYEITVRVVQGARRKRRRHRWLWPLVAARADQQDGGETDNIADETMSPHDALESRQATALLYRFLDQLDEKYRTAVVLFELEGLPCQEIARLTGTSVANVWARVSRGREKLIQEFARWEARQKP